jgi:hypothetical protein
VVVAVQTVVGSKPESKSAVDSRMHTHHAGTTLRRKLGGCWMLECLECGAGNTGSAMACARCGAPIAAQISGAADRAAGESADSAAPAGPGHQSPAKSRVQSASWWAIGGGAAVFLGSLLPWISVHVYDGNLFNAPDDPNLFKAVAVGNSISVGVRRHQPPSA